jgi:hypothetical protein
VPESPRVRGVRPRTTRMSQRVMMALGGRREQ